MKIAFTGNSEQNARMKKPKYLRRN